MRKLLHILALLATPLPALAQEPVSVSLLTPMVADISHAHIEVHSGFTGTQLLVFGARTQPGDLVITVRGPRANMVLRRKERIAGMWMHTDQEKYWHLPQFYGIASTRPLDAIAPQETLSELGLGGEAIIAQSNPRSRELFSTALREQMTRLRTWQLPFGRITYFSESLFKARINLPDRLPRGQFTVEVYLFDRGQLVGLQTIPLDAYKTGFDARVYDEAQRQPWLYGLGAILMALAGGWLAHRLFHRRGA